MHGFFDNSQSHFADDKVYLQTNDFLPFEVAYRFLTAVDPTIRKNRKLNLISDDTASVNCIEGNKPDETYLVIHRLSSDKKTYVDEGAAQEKCEDIAPLNKFLEAVHYDARVIRKENVTHLFWFQRISSCPSIYIKLAFSLRLLCPTLFEGDKPFFCNEWKDVMSFIDKDEYNGAWDKIQPYLIDLRKEQWLVDIKQMFVNSYDTQIERLKLSIDDFYSSIRNLNDQIAGYYKHIEDTEIRIRGMLASNSSEKQYDEFLAYLKDVQAEITGYDDRRIQVKFFGFIDNYDIDVASDVIPSKNGYLYENINDENRDDMELVLRKTFLEEKYKIRVVSTTNLDRRNYNVHCEEYEHHPSSAVYERHGKVYLYNPHLWHYDCYGDRRGDICEAIKNYDYYTVAMYANASNSNIGFGDTAVMPKFAADIIKHRTAKLFYCPADGQDYSFDDILAKEKEVSE